MDLTPRVTGSGPHVRQRVRVPGRDDIGEIVDPGKNFGPTGIYCVGIHFPSTGECVYYDRARVQPVVEQ